MRGYFEFKTVHLIHDKSRTIYDLCFSSQDNIGFLGIFVKYDGSKTRNPHQGLTQGLFQIFSKMFKTLYNRHGHDLTGTESFSYYKMPDIAVSGFFIIWLKPVFFTEPQKGSEDR